MKKTSAMPSQTEIKFIYFTGCPLADPARKALEHALDLLGLECPIIEIDTTGGASPGGMEKYPSPTILVNGRDLFEATRGEAACCRVYPPGALEAQNMARALKVTLSLK